MSNQVAEVQNNSVLVLSENELVEVLQSSLYPGAALSSIKMVISYCKAAGLDPMQKPVHIVPMWDKNSKQMRDVIMPGVGLYRTQAARSNSLAGISKPAYGPMITMDLGGLNITVPESCEVTVKRLMPNGEVAEYTAEEFWVENYATAGKDMIQPNAMWKKRPRGQLAKCAQAQALRMAFPEMTGSAPTADEMEGKQLDPTEIDITPKSVSAQKAELLECTATIFAEKKTGWMQMIQNGKKTAEDLLKMLSTRATFSEEQRKEILSWAQKPAEPATTNNDDFTNALDASGEYSPE